MLFNSFQYIIFLPIVFILYWLIPKKYRWILLLVASYYFYMSWNVKYVVLILFTTAISYSTSILIEKYEDTNKRKAILWIALICCLGVLFFFKYFNFTSNNVCAFLGLFSIKLSPLTLNLVLPVGISFYTFQTLSYVIDVYRGNIRAEKNFGVYATFVSFFPQLVAGPIERTSNLLPQINSEHQFDEKLAMDGVKLMLWGYFKKLVIADNVAYYVDTIFNNPHDYVGIDLLLAVFLFTIQIYCDFSGYSDIAIGTAKMLDIKLMTNFRSPYLSSSVKEFWSRWHISLSTWFKDYVYIPLGGNRCSKLRRDVNLLITFLVSGLWHGANWTFVAWGGLHGLAQVIENHLNFVLKHFKSKKLGRLISMVIVFAFCNIAWVFFRADNFSDAIYMIATIPYGIGSPLSYLSTKIFKLNDIICIFIFILILFMYDFVDYKCETIPWLNKKGKLCSWIFYVFLGAIIVICSRKGVAADFVYFQF